MIWLKQQERIIKEIGIKYVIDMTRGDAFVLLCWVHYVATHDYSKKENKRIKTAIASSDTYFIQDMSRIYKHI